jgi:hypothetical protein
MPYFGFWRPKDIVFSFFKNLHCAWTVQGVFPIHVEFEALTRKTGTA